MANYRRTHIPWGAYFLTIVTHQRYPLFYDARTRMFLREPFSVRKQVTHPTICRTAVERFEMSGLTRLFFFYFRRFLIDGGFDFSISQGGEQEGRQGGDADGGCLEFVLLLRVEQGCYRCRLYRQGDQEFSR